MSTRIRGSEQSISVTVNDEFATAFGINGRLEGSFFKVKEFTHTPRTDLVEEDFIGERFDDLDVQHHGYDFSFTTHENDAAALNFLSLLVYKEDSNLPPPQVTLHVTTTYRDVTVLPRTEVFIGCVMKLSERSNGGRKEYIQNSFEGKAKLRQVFIG